MRSIVPELKSTREITLALVAVTGFFLYRGAACLAQTTPTPANPQIPATQSLQSGVDTSASVTATTAAITPPTVTSTQGVASIRSSSRPGSLKSAGQGLPGMPGGPPIKGSLGYQDPASTYMRPPTIGPLLCDPLLEGFCD